MTGSVPVAEIGHYALACNQLCGNGHYNMQAKIDVVSQEDYAKLVREKSENALKNHADPGKPPASPAPAAAGVDAPAPVMAAVTR